MAVKPDFVMPANERIVKLEVQLGGYVMIETEDRTTISDLVRNDGIVAKLLGDNMKAFARIAIEKQGYRFLNEVAPRTW
jgi:hypothetical protein